MKRLLPFALALPLAVAAVSIENNTSTATMMKKIESIPDSVFKSIDREDLLSDEVYIKLARDGWSPGEIRQVMDSYIAANKPRVRGSYDYARYTKEWLPLYFSHSIDTINEFTDTTSYERGIRAARRAAASGSVAFDNYVEETPYARHAAGENRQPGVFRPVKFKPSSGRIIWIQVNPENADQIMVIPEGGGIARTDDMGAHWDMITDRIPNREHRNLATHSAIPVDPDNWNHVFAFMTNQTVYETNNAGESWTLVEGATHKSFKRGYAFRDKAGTLKFIGAVQKGDNNYWSSAMWVSEDLGRNWYQITIPDELKDYNPVTSFSGNWFQEVAFDPTDRDKIYMPSSNCIYYFDDGVKATVNDDGSRSFNVKRMTFNVWDTDSTEIRVENTSFFPFPGTSQSFLNINPNNPLEMWFASSSRSLTVSQGAAIYRTRDGGKNWITLNEPVNGYGSGNIFGNEAPYGWLGGFGVNYQDQTKLYGCSMSSGKSADGGTTCNEYIWYARMTSIQDDGAFYNVSNASHNADNHCIISHKSGRVFRGSDAGVLMLDPAYKSDWFNIGGNMGQMLFYSIRVNEFGDQTLFGNTQDIDAQTYRYGRWGHYTGYEGSNAFINPYSGMTYYSNHGDGISGGLDYSSWTTTETYADVCTGNWYILQRNAYNSDNKLYCVPDFGRTAERLPIVNSSGNTDNVNSVCISRNAPVDGQSTLWVRTGTNWFRYSHDNFATTSGAFKISDISSVQSVAADPDHWNRLYIANKKTINNSTFQVQVLLVDMETKSVIQDLTYDLPQNVNCTSLLLHEGSGDLYFYSNTTGIYLLPKDGSSWGYWTRGYNIAKSGGVIINYTTQEMVLYDYGRGVWIADLEHPSDRYFSNGFALKELSNIDGRHTIGIDTKWTIPLYYNYSWKVNDETVECPYQYLTRKLNAGDRVQLTLSLRESPDVTTTSAEYVVTETTSVAASNTPGKVLYSNGNGRVDLGYVDLFYRDFTIDLWVKPESNNGVILANGQRTQTRGGRGWWLGLDNGQLKFNYAPANRFDQPTYETTTTKEATLNAGTIPTGKWSHIAVAESQEGNITIYVNGVEAASAARIVQEHTLNNAIYLSLFADGYEESTLAATVDELKIWNYAMSSDDVRRVMYSHHCSNDDGLLYYNDFNGTSLDETTEQFTRKKAASRVMAQTESRDASVTVCADKSAVATIDQSTALTDTEGTTLLTLTHSAGQSELQIGVYRYDSDMMAGHEANIAADRYTVVPTGYVLQAFSSYSDDDAIDLTLPTDIFPGEQRKYKVFAASATDDVSYWKLLGEPTVNAADNSVTLANVPVSDLSGKRIVIAYLDNGIELIPDATALNAEGYLDVYDEDTTIDFSAVVYGSTTVPSGAYTIDSSNADMVKAADDIYFINGQASGTLRIDGSKLGNFGSQTDIVLRGTDDTVIPYTLRLVNRILPSTIGEAVALDQGSMLVGDATKLSELTGSNNVTFMTWMRLDSEDMLSGTHGIMMLRNGTTSSGIYLYNGNIRPWWNGGYPFGGTNTIYTLTSDDIGRWINVAVVITPTRYYMYVNGKTGAYTRTVPTTNVSTQLMLGATAESETPSFVGAFDQTMVWNRALSQGEVYKYMHEAPKLNADGLVTYLNMDYFNSDNSICDVMSDAPSTLKGTVNINQQSLIPYNPTDTITGYSANAADARQWNIPVTTALPVSRVSTFKRYSYNFMSDAVSSLRPLKKESYTVMWPNYVSTAPSGTMDFVFTDDAITAGNELTLAIRPLGSTTPYTTFYTYTPETDGSATFSVDASAFTSAIEMMVFTAAPDDLLQVKLSLPDKETRDPLKYVLRDDETTIPIDVHLLGGTTATDAPIIVDQSAYASVDREDIDPTADDPSFIVNIDRDRLDKKAWNPVTITLMGTECETLTLNVSLSPRVRLYLDNDDPNTWEATSTIATLPIKIEWLQGAMDEDVDLDIVSDLRSVSNSATGSLLTNTATRISSLDYFDSNDDLNDGWNLIGNPYMTDINLTSTQDYYTENTTPFIYHYDPARRNFVVSERTLYDGTKWILPFSPFFVQTNGWNAYFTVTPFAKTKTLSRRMAEYSISQGQNALTLELYNATTGTLEDETKIVWSEDASLTYDINEDADKLWSLDPTQEHIYSIAEDENLAINTTLYRTSTVPLGLRLTSDGPKTIKVKSLTGDFTEIELFDGTTETETALEEGASYTFNGTTGTADNRFEVHVTVPVSTGTDNVAADNKYRVYTNRHYCIVDGLGGNANILISDIQGRVAAKANPHTERYRTELAPGFYVVTINENGKKYVTKIAVKQ